MSEPITIGSFDPWPELHGAWYDDPFGEADLRWWDGTQWTSDVKAADAVAVAGAGGDRVRRSRAPALLAALAGL